MKKLIFFITILLPITFSAPDDFFTINTPPEQPQESTSISLDSYTYVKNGKDWPGLCMTGVHQSPINIIDKINTQDDPHSHVRFLYRLEKEFAESFQKLKYDGRGLSIKAELGSMIFTHFDGTEEVFEATQIDLHYPSEHTITMYTQTPRYPLELNIIHRFLKSSNKTITNKIIEVKKAIVSILFKGDSSMDEGDAFLSRLGIDERLRRPDGSYRTVKKGETIDSSESWLGNIKPGLDITALIALRDLLNFNHWIFRYYGSDTQPPCTEDVHRFVFAVPRSANPVQIGFLKAQLMKERGLLILSKKVLNEIYEEIKNEEELCLDIYKYFGNNRNLQIYDDASNGKIFSMMNGISQIEGLEFPKT